MPSVLQKLARQGSAILSPLSPGSGNRGVSREARDGGFTRAPKERDLFLAVNPTVDGEECLHDCESCTIRYPGKFKIEEDTDLYGWVKGWSTHLLVATGKTDWTRNCEDERGSVMEAIDKCKAKPANGRMMLSATNIPPPEDDVDPYRQPTRVLLLPAFTWVENVTYTNVDQLITHVVNAAPTTTTPLAPLPDPTPADSGIALADPDAAATATAAPTAPLTANHSNGSSRVDPSALSLPASLPFTTRACQHSALILMCSQATRDARCGQSAPLLRREFERHLRPLGLYRDLYDERPGGVGIYFISHTGGHKFSANVMVYRRKGMDRWAKALAANGAAAAVAKEEEQDEGSWGAAQCIWLARVKPNECEGIVKYTILQGKVVKPEWQLRGGFDREKKLVSW